MLQLVLVFLPILAADVINPVLLAAQIYALGSPKAIRNTIFLLLGWFVIYFASGILLAVGLEKITTFLQNPRTIDFYIESVVAILLFIFGFRFLFKKAKQKASNDYNDSARLTAMGSFGIGATINLIGLPFAIPYFAALDQILKADLTWIPSLIALFIYNLLYILPFVILLIIRLSMGERSDALFEKINLWMDKIGKILLPGMMILLGAALAYDAYLFFTTGTPWF